MATSCGHRVAMHNSLFGGDSKPHVPREKETRESLFATDRASERLVKKEKPEKLMENVRVTLVFLP